MRAFGPLSKLPEAEPAGLCPAPPAPDRRARAQPHIKDYKERIRQVIEGDFGLSLRMRLFCQLYRDGQPVPGKNILQPACPRPLLLLRSMYPLLDPPPHPSAR
eukprot:tig00021036_g17292.t1